ncbi:hypothetical protein WJX72_006418 [[Myrmecia] bisecta]|uniref:J domain-containing protein n=1 Tax=[Myrmecia] bisecta TaxID=41462 RepID=A0AAW1PXF3_9CHLO
MAKQKGQDYYSLLGVGPSVSEEEISSAYRRLARKFHPDKLPATASDAERTEAQEHFKTLSQAAATLRDSTARRRYDQQRSADRALGAASGAPFGAAHAASDGPTSGAFSLSEALQVWMDVVVKAVIRQYKISPGGGWEFVKLLGKLGLPTVVYYLGGPTGAKVAVHLANVLNRHAIERELGAMSAEEQCAFAEALQVLDGST